MSVIPDDIKREVDAIIDRLELCGVTAMFIVMESDGRSQCVTTTPPGMVPRLLRVFADSIDAERGWPS